MLGPGRAVLSAQVGRAIPQCGDLPHARSEAVSLIAGTRPIGQRLFIRAPGALGAQPGLVSLVLRRLHRGEEPAEAAVQVLSEACDGAGAACGQQRLEGDRLDPRQRHERLGLLAPVQCIERIRAHGQVEDPPAHAE